MAGSDAPTTDLLRDHLFVTNGTADRVEPSLVGNARRVLVSELSGRSNIAALTEQYGITCPEVTKAVLAEVVRRENLGYQYEAAEASFALVVQKAMRNFTPHFKRIRYQVEVSGYGSIRHGSNTYARSNTGQTPTF